MRSGNIAALSLEVGKPVIAAAASLETPFSDAPCALGCCRVYKDQPYAEVEWSIGPIPFQDNLGKEVILRYSSSIESGDEFWTDSNGREMQRRRRDWRKTWDLSITEPVASNYYPLTAAMYIQDSKAQLAVLTDRAQGDTLFYSVIQGDALLQQPGWLAGWLYHACRNLIFHSF